MILGLEEEDFGSKNGTREGMEGGIVEKRADGLGVFSTPSIYVKYPPHAWTAVFLHFRRFFFRFRRALPAALLCLSLLLVFSAVPCLSCVAVCYVSGD